MANELMPRVGAQVPTDPAQMNEYLRQYAEAYAAQEPSTGQSISARNGVLTVGDQALPGNHFAAVILDVVHLNTFYGSSYNPNTILPPVCYAIGRTDMEMAPHPDMAKDVSFFKPQAERCSACPHNVYGSAPQGAGKACKNKRRMLMLIAGTYNAQGYLQPQTDLEYYETTPLMTLTIAPTSVKNWGAYVRQNVTNYNLPPFGLVTRIYLYRHEKHGKEAYGFETLAPVPNDWMPTIMRRREEAQRVIMQGYDAPPRDLTAVQQQRGGAFQGYAPQAISQGWPR